MNPDKSQRIVLITGANRGIGREAARPQSTWPVQLDARKNRLDGKTFGGDGGGGGGGGGAIGVS